MNKICQLFLVLVLLGAPAIVLAQPASGTNDPGCFPPPCIPIDGGATLLIVAGLAIGGKKAFDARKNNK